MSSYFFCGEETAARAAGTAHGMFVTGLMEVRLESRVSSKEWKGRGPRKREGDRPFFDERDGALRRAWLWLRDA